MILRPAGKGDVEALLDLWEALQADGRAADPRYRTAPDARAMFRDAVREEWTRTKPFVHTWVAEDDGQDGVRVVAEPPAAARVGFRRPGEPLPTPPVSGPLVGYCGGAARPAFPLLKRPPVARIGDMYVAPSRRRRGLGRRLVEAFVDGAKAGGFDAIEVGTLDRDERAVAFWQAMGFSRYFVTLSR